MLSLQTKEDTTAKAAHALSMSIREYNEFMAEGWTVEEMVVEEDHKSTAIKKAAVIVFDMMFDKFYAKK